MNELVQFGQNFYFKIISDHGKKISYEGLDGKSLY